MLRVKDKGGASARDTTTAAIANKGSLGTEGFFYLDKIYLRIKKRNS
jgi:hypothetical protein